MESSELDSYNNLRYTDKTGLNINITKPNWMAVGKIQIGPSQFLLNGEVTGSVQHFKYVGSWLNLVVTPMTKFFSEQSIYVLENDTMRQKYLNAPCWSKFIQIRQLLKCSLKRFFLFFKTARK